MFCCLSSLILWICLKSAVFPDEMKHAMVKPLLKKSGKDRNLLKNFRPIFNLTYLNHGRSCGITASTHMNENNITEPMQSAYRPRHSTETALLHMHNNILRAVHEQKAVALVLLDLSAALTIDHKQHHAVMIEQETWCGRRYIENGSNHILNLESSRFSLMKHCHLLLMYCMVSIKARFLVQNHLQFIHCLLLTFPVNTTWRLIYIQMILRFTLGHQITSVKNLPWNLFNLALLKLKYGCW